VYTTGQTGAGQGSPTSSKQGKEATFSKNKSQKQVYKRNYKEWCDQQEQKSHLLRMPSKGSHGQGLPKW
jgi:hypothetical protein